MLTAVTKNELEVLSTLYSNERGMSKSELQSLLIRDMNVSSIDRAIYSLKDKKFIDVKRMLTLVGRPVRIRITKQGKKVVEVLG